VGLTSLTSLEVSHRPEDPISTVVQRNGDRPTVSNLVDVELFRLSSIRRLSLDGWICAAGEFISMTGAATLLESGPLCRLSELSLSPFHADLRLWDSFLASCPVLTKLHLRSMYLQYPPAFPHAFHRNGFARLKELAIEVFDSQPGNL
jgi:hypothetical protein